LSFAEIFGIRKLESLGNRRSYGVVCVILRLAVSVEHRLVTDRRHTTTAYTALAWRRAVKMLLYVKHLDVKARPRLENYVSASVVTWPTVIRQLQFPDKLLNVP